MLLTADHVSKRYGNHWVIRDISFAMESGGSLGLVGRNGSGKTVLLKCLSGLTVPTSGTITFGGKVLGKEIGTLENCGILIEAPGYLADYSGFDNLKLFMGIRRKPDTEEIGALLERVGLDPDSRVHAGRYSLGMKQRLGIAMALMDHPELLILDEPMNGLDSSGVREMRELFVSLRREGMAMILASHIEGDIQTLCDQVLYLDQGIVIRKTP